ncbi:MAG: hypothetical protein U0Q16_33035 [Bryobacteraceae bacterium]
MSGCFGHGSAIGHVGELLQGALRLRGRVEPFLVTLPAPSLVCHARVRPARLWNVTPAGSSRALRAAMIAAGHCRIRGPLALDLHSAIPRGRGFGSSTADCVAAIRAVADYAGIEICSKHIGAIACEAESASDSTMFGLEPVVFLPRRGECLHRFEGAWPEIACEFLDLGGPPVDTLACPLPRYSHAELDEFEKLLADLSQAFRRRDPSSLGRIATRSGAIHQRHRPHSRWAVLRASASDAHGVAISHSGTAAAILLAGQERSRASSRSSAVAEAVTAHRRTALSRRAPLAPGVAISHSGTAAILPERSRA